MADWQDIRLEYITGDLSYARLAEKHGVSARALQSRGARGGWRQLRQEHRDRVQVQALERDCQTRVDRVERLCTVADAVTELVERSARELDQWVVRRVVKEKTIDYDHPERPDKPTRETVKEREYLQTEQGPIDRAGLKQLSGVLRDLKELQLPGEDTAGAVQILLEEAVERFAR